jgi:hypothetical protein
VSCPTIVRALAVTVLALCALTARASAQTLEAPFAGPYTMSNIGSPPGVPPELGGLTLKAGTTDRLLIGGAANGASGALYEIGVTRDAQGHITGFAGDATRYADAAYNDGGVLYGPGDVLLLARWPQDELGMTKPGSAVTDKIVSLGPLGVASSVSSLGFVPAGMGGAGSFKLASYDTGRWYDADLVPDGNGLFDVVNLHEIVDSMFTSRSGPEGFVFVAKGSPEFAADSLLLSEYGANSVAAYTLDANGDPIVASRRAFITGLSGAEGAFIDPVTGDFLFSTFGTANTVIVVRGFVPPTPTPTPVATATPTATAQPIAVAQASPTPSPTPTPLPPPVAGKNVNATPKAGKVEVRLPGSNHFVDLADARQLPVGTTVDATHGTVTLMAAGGGVADFFGGIFKISQSRGARPLTTLALTEPLNCPRGNAISAAKKKKTRRLWGDGKGAFRTTGQYSSATVRGTKWLTQDRCGSTLTRVVSGAVTVRDFIRHKTAVVRAGKSYTARRKR